MKVDGPVTALAGRGARDLLLAVAREAVGVRGDVAFVPARGGPFAWRRVDAFLRRAARIGRARGGGRTELEHVIQAFELGAFVTDRGARLPDAARRRVALARALLTRPRLLLVEQARGDLPEVRRDTWTLLRWARDARELRIAYVAFGTRDLEDLADELVIADQGEVFGPAEPWDLLGRTLRGRLADEFVVESLLPAAVDYLDEEGRWLRVVVDRQDVYLPFARLSPGWRGRVAVRPESVVLLRERLPGRRLTNQVGGAIAAVGDLWGRRRVDVDLGAGTLLRCAVEPDTVRELGLAPGVAVVCAFEPAAVRWVG